MFGLSAHWRVALFSFFERPTRENYLIRQVRITHLRSSFHRQSRHKIASAAKAVATQGRTSSHTKRQNVVPVVHKVVPAYALVSSAAKGIGKIGRTSIENVVPVVRRSDTRSYQHMPCSPTVDSRHKTQGRSLLLGRLLRIRYLPTI